MYVCGYICNKIQKIKSLNSKAVWPIESRLAEFNLQYKTSGLLPYLGYNFRENSFLIFDKKPVNALALEKSLALYK